MVAKVRLIAALSALVMAVVMVWQSAPPAATGGHIVELQSSAEPMTTIMKSPIVATTNPRPFDPCEDIPFDVVQRLGLSFTPPKHEDGLRCHYDAGNYQLAVEAIIWRGYAETLPPDAVETTINGHRAAQYRVLKPTYHNSYWFMSCMVTFETSYGSSSRCITRRSTPIPMWIARPPICSGHRSFPPTTSSDPPPHNLGFVTATTTRPVRARLRTLARRAGGHALRRLLGLPPATTGYTVSRVRVPMRDGIDLLADHYAPTVATEPAGTLLVRGPYGRGFPFSVAFAGLYAARGYHVVLQSVRGTFGSAGVFEPMIHEAADGADTVAWLRQQPWFTGRFGTIGISYLGFTQWAILQDPPPELAAAVITAGPHDFSASSWGTGSFTVNDFLGWSDLVAHQEDRVRALIHQVRARRRLARATSGLPMGAAGRTLLGAGAPWYESWLEHSDRDDPFWGPFRFGAALDRVRVPVLLLTGWQDLFLRQTLEQYRRLRDRGVDVALTVGPWTHSQLLTRGLRTTTRESLDWLDTHLRSSRTKSRHSTVRVFITGQGWLNLPAWPSATTQRVLYLQPGGRLGETAPPATSPPAKFRYDPADPTPTIGGRMLSPEGGYRKDTRLAMRDDVLGFTGDVLADDLRVTGNPVVELAHTSDNPHVDVFVRVSEVDAKGRSVNVSDGYRRLAHAPDTVSIELDAIAHRFSAGSRIRVLVAGGCHPRYARNLGTDEPPVTGVRLKPATHVVHFGTSRLLLPVASADGVADPGGDPA